MSCGCCSFFTIGGCEDLRAKNACQSWVWGAFIVLGAVINVIPFSLIAWGQNHIDSRLAPILNATTPVFSVILANLCINARDAIAGVGKLTIETGRKSFDEEYCKQHAGFTPGDFVMLGVSDNGCGMDKETWTICSSRFHYQGCRQRHRLRTCHSLWHCQTKQRFIMLQ